MEPKNLLVPIGTPYMNLIDACGLAEHPYKVLSGGPMMGIAQFDLSVPTIKACTAYEIDGKVTDHFPFDAEAVEIKPVYTEVPGWKTDLTAITSKEEFPKAFSDYIRFIESYLGVEVYIVSVGPDRKQTIVYRDL